MINQRAQLGKLFNTITFRIMCIIIVSIFPLNLLVITSTSQAIELLKRQAQASLKSVVDSHAQQFDSRITRSSLYLYDLSDNNSDFQVFSRNERDDAYFIAKSILARNLSSTVASGREADGYFIRNVDLDDIILMLPEGSVYGNVTQTIRVRRELENWLSSLEPGASNDWERRVFADELLLVRIYQGADVMFGSIFSLTTLQRDIENEIGFSERRVYADTQLDIESNHSDISVSSALTKVNLFIHVVVPEAEIMYTLPTTQWLAVFLAFAYLSLIPLLLLILNRILIRPLNGISKAILSLKEGNRKYRIAPVKGASDFQNIGRAFNEMADSIEELKVENYEKELARQDMELRNLQLQIHPHFLLNMLHLGYNFMHIGDAPHAQKLLLYLSDYFRYIFRGGKSLEPFSMEFGLIQAFLDLSALRNSKCFMAEYDVEDEVLDVEIPPLLIHGFIENIIKHALKPGEQIQIRLAAAIANGWVVFTIQDSGAGIDAQTVQDINSGAYFDCKVGHNHIGLANAYQRLRYFFGECSELSVMSTYGVGTSFTIRFPLPTEESHESSHCE
ncbi:MAG: histidine kinase [Oscillospiraceae bacterium]|nr:histidine kinase [Oscillospiraceae bacterium]